MSLQRLGFSPPPLGETNDNVSSVPKQPVEIRDWRTGEVIDDSPFFTPVAKIMVVGVALMATIAVIVKVVIPFVDFLSEIRIIDFR